ncbi:MAG: branched-chain amino acid ABC transporter permease [Firmicutes bacterium]|jgi:branched-chain amino acid transport system permease protein|nr:branched-chain amino acid ABC transporter permease [Bacillota bacterium]
MNASVFFQQLINGMSLGSLYALLAIGYTMVYGILRFINFAHSDIFMVGAYFAFFSIVIFRIPWPIAAILSIGLTALVGMAIDRVAYRPVRDAPRISALITAVGVSSFLENLGLVTVGARPKAFESPSFMSKLFHIGDAAITGVAIWVPVITLGFLIVMMYIVYKTKVGMAMRAVSTDIDATRLMGVDVDKVISYTFALGSALAAVGGILWACKYPKISPLMGVYPGWKAFTAAVVGGIGSIPGAMIGGFIIGLIEVMTVAISPGLSGYRDGVIFLVLVIFLLLRPTGILGETLKEKV